MNAKRQTWLYVVSIFILTPFLFWLIAYAWLLMSSDILDHPLVRVPAFPVVCSTRGCITSSTWIEQYNIQSSFGEATDTQAPTIEESLTTTVRQFLVKHAFLRLPVTVGDARRYREQVLQVSNDDLVLQTTGLSIDNYDKMVILPLLQQEALRQERGVENFDELFHLLAKERLVSVLPAKFTWDKETASVIRD